MKKNSLLLIALLSAFHLLNAQGFRVKAPVAKVQASGFYKIMINPDLSAHARADLSDIRIVNQQNTQIPYIVQNRPTITNAVFTKLNILSNTTDKKNTVLQLENKASGTDLLYLVMANTAVERYASISGSNDKLHWYIIDDYILLRNSDDQQSGRYIQTIQFPFSKYPYLKLEIHNEHTDPLNIIEAGTFNQTGETPLTYQRNPGTRYYQIDSSDGHSYIFINNKETYITERISLQMNGPKFFSRPASLFALSDKNMERQELAGTILSSTQSSITLNESKDQQLLLLIQNGDNPPLKITGLYTEQANRYLVSYLEANEQYSILAGNNNAARPEYDLSQFKDSIPKEIPVVGYGTPVPVASTPSIKPTDRLNKWLWPMIITGILFLSFLTYKLVSDMKQSEEKI